MKLVRVSSSQDPDADEVCPNRFGWAVFKVHPPLDPDALFLSRSAHDPIFVSTMRFGLVEGFDQVTVAGFIARDAQEELLDSRLPWCGPPFGERPWGVFNDSPRGQLILPPTNYRPSIHKGRGRVIGTGAILPSTSLPDQGRRPAREQLIPVQCIMAGFGVVFRAWAAKLANHAVPVESATRHFCRLLRYADCLDAWTHMLSADAIALINERRNLTPLFFIQSAIKA